MRFPFTQKSPGFTLLEFLIATLVSTVICMAAVHLFKQALGISTLWRKETMLLRTTTVIGGYLQNVLDDSDSHRFSLLPRTTLAQLTYADSSPLPIRATPHPESSVIFSTELCRSDPIEFTHRFISGGAVRGRACFIRPPKCDPPYPAGALGITPTGVFEVEMEAENTPSPCKTISIRPSRGVTVSGAQQINLFSVSKIMLVKRSYALYVNDNQELRWIGFRGDSVVEHQPLLRNTLPFRVEFSLTPHGVIESKIEIHTALHPLFLSGTLSRHGFINALYQ